jgi:glycolate oxidase iron-sulfur subunit
LLAKIQAFKPMAAMLELAPRRTPREIYTASEPPKKARGRVAVLQGCVEPVLRPEFQLATARVLGRLGFEVIEAPGEGCCGALVHHMGRVADAHAAARRNVDAWTAAIEAGGLGAIIITASGCGTTIKDYGFLLRDDPDYRDKAAYVSSIATDISEFLVRHELPPTERRAIKVAYQSACSLQHGQQVSDAPVRLLEAAGYIVSTPEEAHLCCGSAGVYNVLQPDIAAQLGDRKAQRLSELDADVVATGNIGCATQVAARLQIPVVHTVELLDWATGGPMPSAMQRTR